MAVGQGAFWTSDGAPGVSRGSEPLRGRNGQCHGHLWTWGVPGAAVGGGSLENREARAFARPRGIIIADTKFEFGLDDDGDVVLIDEVLTPDSSRFWPAESYRTGISPPSFDKQFVRDHLESTGWNKRPPAPRLPVEVVRKTAEKYAEARRRLVGD